nr:hypothetical protein [Clostridium botulinum]
MKMYCNCNLIDQKICCICDNEYEYFFSKPNVVGVGLGYKVTKGFYTKDKCIKVFVTRKLPNNQLAPQQLIPTIYKGIKTDIFQSGKLETRSLTNKVRPIIGGYSIGAVGAGSTGTLGCLVTKNNDYFILSNNHVIARWGTVPLNTPILQPGIQDKGNPKTDKVAVLSEYVPIKFQSVFSSPINYVDCAIAKVINKSIASSAIAFIGKPESTIVPRLNAKVQKVGRTTELTIGTVIAINCTVEVICPNNKIAKYKNQISTTAMEKIGDSGSVLLDENKNIMGLLMSGGDSTTTYNPIKLVLDSLKVRIVNK